MIRVFELICKLNFINFTAVDLYLISMENFQPSRYKCPHCSTRHPDWKQHAVYVRYLISFENEKSVIYQITIIRYMCSSCEHTHAVLPEFIIPYRSYSIFFILSVMKDYFSKILTIEAICSKYDISPSTLYSWKKLFLLHKKIWLGLLDNAYTSSLKFLDSIFDKYLDLLQEFFLISGVSFLQSPSRIRKAHSPPT